MSYPKRKAYRMSSFSYSSAATYFITICTKNRECLLSSIEFETPIVGAGVPDRPSVRLTAFGQIVYDRLAEMENVYDYLSVENLVIMPNHLHALLTITDRGQTDDPAESAAGKANEAIPALISTFKRYTNKAAGRDLWQRAYYDHVVRNEMDYRAIWDYIEFNPSKWLEDEYYTPRESENAVGGRGRPPLQSDNTAKGEL